MRVPPENQADATLEDAAAEVETVRETVRSGGRSRPPSNRRTIGRYQILEPLGKDGMGEVWAAHDPHLKRKVPVKLLRPDIEDAVHEERLLSEARAMARLSHPNEKAGETEVSWYGETLFLHGRALLGVKHTPEGLALMERGLELMKSHGSKKKYIAQATTRLADAKRR